MENETLTISLIALPLPNVSLHYDGINWTRALAMEWVSSSLASVVSVDNEMLVCNPFRLACAPPDGSYSVSVSV